MNSPKKTSWNLKMIRLKIKRIFQASVFRFHVCFRGFRGCAKASNWYKIQTNGGLMIEGLVLEQVACTTVWWVQLRSMSYPGHHLWCAKFTTTSVCVPMKVLLHGANDNDGRTGLEVQGLSWFLYPGYTSMTALLYCKSLQVKWISIPASMMQSHINIEIAHGNPSLFPKHA